MMSLDEEARADFMKEPESWEIDLSEGFSSCWPFVTYKGMPNFRSGGYGEGAQSYQILFNAIERKYLIKLEMPEGVIS